MRVEIDSVPRIHIAMLIYKPVVLLIYKPVVLLIYKPVVLSTVVHNGL